MANIPSIIAVAVTQAHIDAQPQKPEAGEHAPEVAALEALRADPRMAECLPDVIGVDIITTETDQWRVNLWHRLGKPWDGFVTLKVWQIDDDEAIDGLWNCMYGEDMRPFEFDLRDD